MEFDKVSDRFNRWGPRLWHPLGEITAAYAELRGGERVLDACCGTGASAIPAANEVGVDGKVVGIDLSPRMIELATQRATASGLTNTTFQVGDATALPDGSVSGYDIVICGFGIFFFPNLAEGGNRLVSKLRPGGALVVSTWRADGMDRIVELARKAAEPYSPLAASEGRSLDSDPRMQVNRPSKLHSWLAFRGLREIKVCEVVFRQPLTEESAWNFVCSASPRRFLDGLNPDTVEKVRGRFENLRVQSDLNHLDGTTLLGRGINSGE